MNKEERAVIEWMMNKAKAGITFTSDQLFGDGLTKVLKELLNEVLVA